MGLERMNPNATSCWYTHTRGYTYWVIDDDCIRQWRKIKKQMAIDTIKEQPFY